MLIDLTDDEKREIGATITEGWLDDNTDRDEWLQDLQKWANAYQGRPERKDLPWAGAANLHVPVTATVIDAMHPRLMAALFRPEPIVGFRPQDPSDVELAVKRERFMDYTMREEIHAYDAMDRIILGMAQNGVQFVRASWDLRIRKIRKKHRFPKETPPEQAVELIVQSSYKTAEALKRVGDMKWELTAKRVGKVDIETEIDDFFLYIYVTRNEVIRDCPRVDVIHPEDISVNSDASADLQDTDHVYHRYWMTVDQIKRESRNNIFYKLSDEDIEKLEGLENTNNDGNDTTSNVKQEREGITGVNTTYRDGSPARVELIDAYMRWDIDDDGEEEELIVTVPRDFDQLVLRCVRLEDVYEHGLRPFVAFRLYPVANTFWSIGIPQILEGLQEEFNIIHNQRADAAALTTTPWGVYVPGSDQPAVEIRIKPGVLTPVDDVDNFKMHNLTTPYTYSFEEEALLWTLVERRTKVNDLTLGRVGESQGVARTATGVEAISAQQATGFDILIRRVQESWKLLLQQILALYQQYMPPDRELRILGADKDDLTVIRPDDLLGAMDMVFTGNSLSTDREVERNAGAFLAQGPFSQAGLQWLMSIGVVTPQGVGEWHRWLGKIYDVPMAERIIQIPAMPIIRTPEEVINQVTAGADLNVQAGEDHQSIVDRLMMVLSTPGGTVLPPETLMVIQKQIAMRQQAIMVEQQLMMMMQAQQMAAMGTPDVQAQGVPGGTPVPQRPTPGPGTY